jgi:tripartite-type tricarboxylate transporter receptor subunit TctC
LNELQASRPATAFRRTALRILLAASLPWLVQGMAHAQADQQAANWPERPLRMVVPYPAGGSADTVARSFGQLLGEKLGQPIVIENKPGASGNIGTMDVQRSKADGYTLLFNPSAHVINPEIMDKSPYRALDDFTPVTQVAKGPLVLMVSPALPVKTLADFVQFAKARPKEVSFATSVIGSASHIAEELFNRNVKVDILIVPYKGNAPALNDLMGGQVSAMFDPAVTAVPLARGGKVKALAVTGKTRLASAPEIPTTAEAGMAGLEFYTWYGLWAPKGLPEAIAAKLEAASRQAVATAAFQASMADKGLETIGSSRAEFAALITSESELYRSIAKHSNIRATPN